jgi:hypothetical protein
LVVVSHDAPPPLFHAPASQIGRALREGRRIKADKNESKMKGAKKKKKGKKKGMLDFGAKRYHAKIMDVAHAKVDPNGAIVVR